MNISIVCIVRVHCEEGENGENEHNGDRLPLLTFTLRILGNQIPLLINSLLTLCVTHSVIKFCFVYQVPVTNWAAQ